MDDRSDPVKEWVPTLSDAELAHELDWNNWKATRAYDASERSMYAYIVYRIEVEIDRRKTNG